MENSLSTSFYDQRWRNEPEELNRHERDRFATVLALAQRMKRPNQTILEVGCGVGKLACRLPVFGHVTGLDSSVEAIRRASSRYPWIQFDSKDWLTADLESLKDRFGLTVCSEVIEHIPVSQRARFFNRLASTLVAGGHLIMTTPNGERACRHFEQHAGLYQPEENYLNERELTCFIEDQGLIIRSVRTATFMEAAWESSSAFRRLRTLLPRNTEGLDVIDRLLCYTRLGLYLVIWAQKPS
jgi:2-polyprenyl-3-methyl-5-hydroxy-6-metoxy-1,4-benzoquinol methylase